MPVAPNHQALSDFDTMTPAEIACAILAYLTTQGFTAWQQNTTGIYDPDTKQWRVNRQEGVANPQDRHGAPAIVGFRQSDGVFIGVEIKAGRDQLRPDQRAFLDELKAAGGLPFVAHSFAQFQQSFELRQLTKNSHSHAANPGNP